MKKLLSKDRFDEMEMTRLTNAEIDAIESRLGVRLPGLYRKLLVEVGHGAFGQRADAEWNTSKELYHPDDVAGLYCDFFDDHSVLFSRYFPFGCDNDKQEVWVIDAAQEKAAGISHETHPNDWNEGPWVEYADWITAHLSD